MHYPKNLWFKNCGFGEQTQKIIEELGLGNIISYEKPSAALERSYAECREVIDKACRENFISWANGLEEEDEED